ncbi:N-alpha-acetyltransferase 30 [Aphanomyces cochlioides]|nr:N-alpha-acetyltransferase 30 [Aphanomyces cochlioides]
MTIVYSQYESENELGDLMALFEKDLSEPYSMYTYRYFLYSWPELCILARSQGVVVGYIAMLAVEKKFRKHGIGSSLVKKAIDQMIQLECDEVVLETEVTNIAAIRLYENLGFVKDERLLKYYLNGVDAFRLKLWMH